MKFVRVIMMKEQLNDKIIVQNNNDELKSLKLPFYFRQIYLILPPSVSTFLDEYASMLKENSLFGNRDVSGHTDFKGSKNIICFV